MPYKQQKKLNKAFIITLIFVVLMLSTLFWPVRPITRAVASTVFAALFVFIRRGYIQFTHALRILKEKGVCNQVWTNLERALKSGVSAEYQISVGTVMVQFGNIDRGIEVLKGVMEKTWGRQEGFSAGIALSTGLWLKGDVEGSIELLEEIKNSGYSDPAFFVNYVNFCLSSDDMNRAKKAVTEAKKKGIVTQGMRDNIGCYYILNKNWDKAEKQYNELVEDEEPSFPDAYVHAAQVAVHNGNSEKAEEYLGYAAAKRFSYACPFTYEYIQELRKLLNSEKKKKAVMDAMEENVKLVAFGKPFGEYCIV